MITVDRTEPMPPHQQAAFGALLDALANLRVAAAHLTATSPESHGARAMIMTGIERIERLAESVGALKIPDVV